MSAKSKFIRFGGSILALGLFVTHATAADLEAAQLQPNWERFYFGGYLGGTIGAKADEIEDSDFFEGQQGAASGLQMGVNFQTGNSMVWGIEADVGLAGLNWWATTARSFSMDIASSVRARLGLATGNHLLFLTGGVGILSGETGTDDDVLRSTVVRPVVGLGWESMVTPSMSVKAEGLVFIGSDDFDFQDTDAQARVDSIAQFRLGMNYFFGQPGGAEIMVMPDHANWNRFYMGGYSGTTVAFAYENDTFDDFGRTDHGSSTGLQIGANWDFQHVVLGLEADIGNGGLTWLPTTGGKQLSLHALSSIRGRVGLPIDNHLIYATAGAGILTIEGFDSGDTEELQHFVRPVVGIGVESMITNAISVKAEGLAFIGEDSIDWGSSETEGRIDTVGQFRLGINYHMGGEAGGKADDANWTKGQELAAAGPNWERFYIGGYFGGTIGEKAFDEEDTDFFSGEQGFASGLQMGANFRATDKVVWGIEADVGFSGLTWWATTGRAFSQDVTASVRGRLGMPIDNHLLFVSGGIGILSGETSTDSDQRRDTKIRPVAGLGIESMVTPNMSFKAEGLVFIGTDKFEIGEDDEFVKVDNIAQFRLGMNYHFGEAGGAEIMVLPEQANWNRLYVGGFLGGVAAYAEEADGGDNFAWVDQGFSGGLKIGANWDQGSFVWGIEADVSNGGLVWAPTTAGEKLTVHAMSSIRGRIGLPVDNHLVFVTAGAGMLTAEGYQSGDTNELHHIVRPVVGIGVESMISDSLSLFVEGQAYIGDDTVSAGTNDVTIDTLGKFNLGINYHIN